MLEPHAVKLQNLSHYYRIIKIASFAEHFPSKKYSDQN